MTWQKNVDQEGLDRAHLYARGQARIAAPQVINVDKNSQIKLDL